MEIEHVFLALTEKNAQHACMSSSFVTFFFSFYVLVSLVQNLNKSLYFFAFFFFWIRWSAIAARLPGRTDNEIKNVWHTHLKKRVKQSGHNVVVRQETSEQPQDEPGDQVLVSSSEKNDNINEDYGPVSPHQSSTIISDISLPVYSNYCDNSTKISDNNINNNASTMADYSPGNSIYEVDDNFWSEAFSTETYNSAFISSEVVDGFSSISDYQELLHFPLLETSSYNYEQNNIDDLWTFCSTA